MLIGKVKLFMFGATSLGSGQYTFTAFANNNENIKYLRQGDYIESNQSPTTGYRYKVLSWDNPLANGDVQNNTSNITVEYVDVDTAPADDGAYTTDVYTLGQEDVNPLFYTSGSISTVSLYSGQNYEYSLYFTPNQVSEANNAEIGDYLVDSTGKKYEFTFIGGSRFSAEVRVREVEKEGNIPDTGWGAIYKPTETLGLYTGSTNDVETDLEAVDNWYLDRLNKDISATCPTGVSIGDAVYFSDVDTVDKADASNTDTVPAIGFVISKSSQTDCVVRTFGEVSSLSLSASANQPYFLDTTAGSITDTPPSGVGHIVQKLGTNKSSTVLLASPESNFLILS